MEQESPNLESKTESALLDARLEAFAMCMICNTEYLPDKLECPQCHVALSLVRRCHNCTKVVSAKHRRCIHCGLAFFPDGQQEEFNPEDALDRIAAFRKLREASKKRKTIRGLMVSVATFISVLFLATLITRQFSKPAEAVVIATSYVLRPAELRRAASDSSANITMFAGREVIDITGFVTGERDRRWVAVKWNDETAYLRAEAVAPPKPKEPVRGFEVLRFYIAGIEDPAVIPDAAKAVAYYNQAFPQASSSGQELRWILGEHARYLAARGKSKEELLAEARAQYQILIDAKSEFAEKARAAMNAPLPTVRHAERQAGRRESDLTVVGEQPDTQTITGFGKKPAHEVMLLERANIPVRVSRPGSVKEESAIACSVARNIESNRRVVIPAGAPCQIRITDLQDKTATLTLAAVTVRNRSYDMRTTTAVIRNTSSERTLQELSFRLQSPIAFTK